MNQYEIFHVVTRSRAQHVPRLANGLCMPENVTMTGQVHPVLLSRGFVVLPLCYMDQV